MLIKLFLKIKISGKKKKKKISFVEECTDEFVRTTNIA